MVRRWLKATGMVMVGLTALGWWATGGIYTPGESVVPPRNLNIEAGPVSPPGELKVVSWNIAWGYGWGSEGSGAPRTGAEIRSRVDQMAQVIKTLNADVVALQEVDFDCKRSGFMDQAEYIATAAGYPFVAPVVSWRAGYVPFPGSSPTTWWGKMVSGGAILSRLPIRSHQVVLFPKPAENPAWYNAFYLGRYVHRVEIEKDGQLIALYNTHLEAFQSGSRMEQADDIRERLERDPAPHIIFTGDLNTGLPEATRLFAYPDEPQTDHRGDTTLRVLRKVAGFQEAGDTGGSESAGFTFPAHQPNRRLDHLLFRGPWRVARSQTYHAAGDLSDHLPIGVEFTSAAAPL